MRNAEFIEVMKVCKSKYERREKDDAPHATSSHQ